jgi:hypothetical protein
MISNSVGVVFVDCDKCNPNCELQKQLRQCENITVWKPFGEIKEYMIRTRNLLVGTDKIAQNAQELYDLARKVCYNCKERQR